MAIADVVKLFDTFKKHYDNGETELCTQLMAQIRVAMIEFTSLPPAIVSMPSPSQQQELLLTREILEHGALLSIKTMAIPAFERYVAQLKIYYSDFATTLPLSQRQFPILGLNLLRLLAQNRIAEFHTELELIDTDVQHTNVYIKYPAQLEQHIMEGSYNKVLAAKQDAVFAQEVRARHLSAPCTPPSRVASKAYPPSRHGALSTSKGRHGPLLLDMTLCSSCCMLRARTQQGWWLTHCVPRCVALTRRSGSPQRAAWGILLHGHVC